MNGHFTQVASVIAIIAGAGLVGGWAAYLVEDRRSPEDDRRRLRRFLVLGVIAAACVPLFLSLVRSQLTQAMFDENVNPDTSNRWPIYYESYLVFSGICLIAAFSARRFIDSISKQVLRQLEQVQETARGAAATAADARQVAHETASEVEAADENSSAPLPPDVEEEGLDEGNPDAGPVTLSADERAALQAMTRRTYRTRTGIAEDSGISRNRISEVLDSLHQKKLAVPTKSPTTGGNRWIITRRGQGALSA